MRLSCLVVLSVLFLSGGSLVSKNSVQSLESKGIETKAIDKQQIIKDISAMNAAIAQEHGAISTDIHAQTGYEVSSVSLYIHSNPDFYAKGQTINNGTILLIWTPGQWKDTLHGFGD